MITDAELTHMWLVGLPAKERPIAEYSLGLVGGNMASAHLAIMLEQLRAELLSQGERIAAVEAKVRGPWRGIAAGLGATIAAVAATWTALSHGVPR